MLTRTVRQRWRRWLGRHRADVILISPPGSGRTWLAAMLSHYYHLTAGAPADQLIKQDAFYRGLKGVPRFFLSHPSQIWGARDAERAVRLHRGKPTIFMIRDPRDAAMSQVFHRNFRDARSAAASATDGPTGERPFRNLDQLHGKLTGALRSLARIEAVAAALPQHVIVSYEGLLGDPERGLSEVLRFVGSVPQPDAVAAAVAHCGFAAMREREQDGQSKARALRAFDPANPQSYKARRGEIGGYATYLTPDERSTIDGIVAAQLPPRLSWIIRRRLATARLSDPWTADDAADRKDGGSSVQAA